MTHAQSNGGVDSEDPSQNRSKGNGNTTKKVSYHLMSIEGTTTVLQSDIKNGLSRPEAEKRLERDGPNCFTPPPETAWYWLYLKEMTGGFAMLSWLSAVASFIIFAIEGGPADAYLGVILVITILITATFSYNQQASSSKVFKSFKKLIPAAAFVLRDGKKQTIPVEEIVIGDIVYVQAGDIIPADIRVIHSDNLKVDNSSITGESEPLLRSSEIATEKNALEASNMAFFSTNCTDGSGTGIVVAIGDRTFMGDIAAIVTNITQGRTPIGREIWRFVVIITIISIVVALLFGGIDLYFGATIFECIPFMIGIMVGITPEGLLPALTVALALTAKRMASKNCRVKHLEAVETLGSTSTICSDKTGTLTQNRMTVGHCWFGRETYLFRDHLLTGPGKTGSEVIIRKDFLALQRCAMLCSRAEFLEQEIVCAIEDWPCSGDASEQAIMRFMELLGPEPVVKYRERYPKIAEKPFNSSDKHQFSIHSSKDFSGEFAGHFLVMKGAPERILALCTKFVDEDGESKEMDEDFLNLFERAYHTFGSEGQRVLAFCDLELDSSAFPEGHQFPPSKLGGHVNLKDLRFLGLISLMDPPKEGVAQAVKLCRTAGIRVVMVTGDHPITAQAIAKQVNIVSASHRRSTLIRSFRTTVRTDKGTRSIVIPGDELAEMDDEHLKETMMNYGEMVFARTSPQQKLRIVKAFQELGEIVAVTGDGVNDSPALKKADIGIAMGISGSDVSKQAADMILLDDNFSTIVTGIEEGRRIFDNMKKTISYIFGGNVCTIYPFIVYIILGIPVAITPITTMMIALGTDIFPAISLTYEKVEGDIMHIKPRDAKKDWLVNFRLQFKAYLFIGILACATAYVGYFRSMHENGFTPSMLLKSRQDWYNKTLEMDHYVWHEDGTSSLEKVDFETRSKYLKEAQSAYFCGVVVAQWVDVIICKTRRVSVITHGFGNLQLNLSILLETFFTALAIYVPAINNILGTLPVSPQAILYCLPILPIMFLLEEARKYVIRTWPNSKLGYAFLA